MLYHIISMSLLPREYKDLPVNGKGDAVVVLDLSDRFSLLRLSKIMQNYVSSNWSTFSALISEHEVSSLISDSLAHLHIFRPQSTPSLLATLDSIPSYLLAQPSTHFSANRPLGLLAINDLSSFLWQDRLDADNETSLPTTSGIEKANNNLFVNRYRSLVSSLCRVQQLFSCTIVATNWGLAPVTHVAGHPSLRPHLPSVWNNFCTVKIVVERERVSKFGPGLSAEVAAKEGPQRWEAVGRSRFTGWVNWWDSEGWREEVREGVKGLEKGGSFSFSATDQGIVFVDDDDDDDDDDNDDNDDDVDDDEEG